jgi:hypothetical protein
MARAVRTCAGIPDHHSDQLTQHLCLKIGHWMLLAHRLGRATKPSGSQEGRQRRQYSQRARRESSNWTPTGRAITMRKPHSPLSRHDLRICASARIANGGKECAQGGVRGEGGEERLSEDFSQSKNERQGKDHELECSSGSKISKA